MLSWMAEFGVAGSSTKWSRMLEQPSMIQNCKPSSSDLDEIFRQAFQLQSIHVRCKAACWDLNLYFFLPTWVDFRNHEPEICTYFCLQRAFPPRFLSVCRLLQGAIMIPPDSTRSPQGVHTEKYCIESDHSTCTIPLFAHSHHAKQIASLIA